MRQRRCIEFLAYYVCKISYHTRKENVVADTMSGKEMRVSYHLKSITLFVTLGISKQL